jgi:hypothetical protein
MGQATDVFNLKMDVNILLLMNKKSKTNILEFHFRFGLGWFSIINNLIKIYNNITN